MFVNMQTAQHFMHAIHILHNLILKIEQDSVLFIE